jgi:hypothetical protein
LQFKTSITWKYAGLPSQPIAGCTGFLLLTKGLGDAEIRRIIVTGLPRQKKKKFPRPHLNRKKLSMMVHTCHPSYRGSKK